MFADSFDRRSHGGTIAIAAAIVPFVLVAEEAKKEGRKTLGQRDPEPSASPICLC